MSSSIPPTGEKNPKGFYTSPFWTGYLATQQAKLPKLPDVQSCSPDGLVVRFLGGNPGPMQLQGTNTYLVGNGRSRILIDTGEGRQSWIKNLAAYLDDHDLTISHVLLTHHHNNHTGGVADLLLHDPNIPVYKHNPAAAQHPIHDSQVFTTQGATLTAVLTPGHSTDHACFVLQPDGSAADSALFTGDNVLGHGYSVAEDLGAYTASLRRMRSLACVVGYPGHGSTLIDLPRILDMYISQRDARERRVYAALAQHASGLTVEDVGVALYGDAARDHGTFEAALKPLLDQVLGVLADRGHVDWCLGRSNRVKCWFVV